LKQPVAICSLLDDSKRSKLRNSTSGIETYGFPGLQHDPEMAEQAEEFHFWN